MSARASILPVFVPHLGCPHDCVFCNQRRITGEPAPVDAKRLREILSALPADRRAEAPQLAFYGGSFTAIPEERQIELLEEARRAIDRGIVSSIRLSTRPDAVDAARLERLKVYGVDTVEIGAQSMDDEVLRLSGRGHTAEDVRRASGLVKSSGLKLVLQMMTGLPGDTEEKSLRTARELIGLRPDGVRIYPTVIVRDTALFALWQRGLYREHTVEDAVRLCAKLLPLFEAAGVPVIRVGLNPTDELSGGAAVAGAYHPAFGELVRSRILLEKAELLLKNAEPGSRVVLGVRTALLSQMLGQKKQNLFALMEEFRLGDLRVEPNSSISGEIEILSIENY